MKPFRQRKSPRLSGYDYSQAGAYFITICTHQRQHLFGCIKNGDFFPDAAGVIAADCWNAIPTHYPDVELDAFVIMPNHVHGILLLTGDNTGFQTFLGRVINAYKGVVTTRVRKLNASEAVVWQGRYYDHIIRSEESFYQLRQYVLQNPQLWLADVFFGD